MDAAARGAGDGFTVMGGVASAALGGVVASAATAAAGAIVGFVGSSISAASDFEGAVNNLAAISGTALADAGFSFDDVSAKALELGQTTAYSASEAIAAMTELVKGGVPVVEVMGDATDNTLALAAAAGVELASAAEIVAKQFGVWAETGVTTGEVADLLTQAANASTVGVEDLALGLANAGGTAKVAGVEFEDLVQSMALIAPNFSSASDAGTSFKTFLSRLVPTTAPATKAMQDLGLMTTNTTKMMEALRAEGIEPMGTDVQTLSNQLLDVAGSMGMSMSEASKWLNTFDTSVFYDMSGSFVGMEEAARLLQTATKDLSEEERLLAFNTIFGADAIRAAAAIADAGAEGFNAMGESMAGAGGAAEVAALQNQGFGFAMDSMKGSVETLQIVLGTLLLPVLTSLLNDVITPGINTVTTMAQAFGGNAESMAALSPQLQAIVVGIQQAIPIIQQIAAEIGANWQPILAAVAGVIGAVVVPALASFVVAAAPVIAAVVAAIAIGAALYGAWTSNFMGIQQLTASALAAVQALITSVMGIVLAFWQQNGAEIMAFAQVAWQGVQNIVGTVVAILMEVVTRVFTFIAGFISAHGDEILAVLTTAWNNIQTIVDTTIKAVQGILNTTMALIKGDWEGALTEIKGVATTVWEGIKTVIGNNIDLVKGLIQGLMDKLGIDLKGTLDKVGSFFDPFKGALDGIKSAISSVIDFVSDLISKFEALKGAIPDELIPGSPTPFEIGMRGIAGAIRTETIPAVQGLSGAMRGAGEGSQAISQRTYSLQRIVNVSQTFNSVPRGYRQDAAIVRSLAGV